MARRRTPRTTPTMQAGGVVETPWERLQRLLAELEARGPVPAAPPTATPTLRTPAESAYLAGLPPHLGGAGRLLTQAEMTHGGEGGLKRALFEPKAPESWVEKARGVRVAGPVLGPLAETTRQWLTTPAQIPLLALGGTGKAAQIGLGLAVAGETAGRVAEEQEVGPEGIRGYYPLIGGVGAPVAGFGGKALIGRLLRRGSRAAAAEAGPVAEEAVKGAERKVVAAEEAAATGAAAEAAPVGAAPAERAVAEAAPEVAPTKPKRAKPVKVAAAPTAEETEAARVEIVGYYHDANTALAGLDHVPTRHEKMIQAAKDFSRAHPEVTEVHAYKMLDAALEHPVVPGAVGPEGTYASAVGAPEAAAPAAEAVAPAAKPKRGVKVPPEIRTRTETRVGEQLEGIRKAETAAQGAVDRADQLPSWEEGLAASETVSGKERFWHSQSVRNAPKYGETQIEVGDVVTGMSRKPGIVTQIRTNPGGEAHVSWMPFGDNPSQLHGDAHFRVSVIAKRGTWTPESLAQKAVRDNIGGQLNTLKGQIDELKRWLADYKTDKAAASSLRKTYGGVAKGKARLVELEAQLKDWQKTAKQVEAALDEIVPPAEAAPAAAPVEAAAPEAVAPAEAAAAPAAAAVEEAQYNIWQSTIEEAQRKLAVGKPLTVQQELGLADAEALFAEQGRTAEATTVRTLREQSEALRTGKAPPPAQPAAAPAAPPAAPAAAAAAAPPAAPAPPAPPAAPAAPAPAPPPAAPVNVAEGGVAAIETVVHAHIERAEAQDLLRWVAERTQAVPALAQVQRVVNTAGVAGLDDATKGFVGYRLVEEIQDGTRILEMNRLSGMGNYSNLYRDGMIADAAGKRIPFNDAMSGYLKDPKKWQHLPEGFRRQIDEAKAIVDQHWEWLEKVLGRKLPHDKSYLPRFVRNQEGKVILRVAVGAKQSPLKRRIYDAVADAISEQPYLNYGKDPMLDFDLYIRAVDKMNRDASLAQWIMKHHVGRTPSQRLNAAIATLKRRLAGPANTPAEIAERQADLAKLNRLRAGKTALMTAKSYKGETTGAMIGPGLQSTVMPMEAAKRGKAILGAGTSKMRPAQMAAAVPRLMITGTLDVGQGLLQGLNFLYNHPARWAKAFARSFQAAATPRAYARHLAADPKAIRAARYGVDQGASEFFEALPFLRRLAETHVGRIPVGAPLKLPLMWVNAIAHGFDGFLTEARNGWFDAFANIAQKTGAGEAELYRLGRASNTMLGTPQLKGLGLSATQRQVEGSFVFFSSRFTRSAWGLIGYSFGKGLAPGIIRRELATFMGGSLLTTAALVGIQGRAAGKSDKEIWKDITTAINPASGKKFMGLNLGGHWYGFGGSTRAAFAFLAEAFDPRSWAQRPDGTWGVRWGSVSDAMFDNPISRYLRSRTSPVTGTLIDFIEGEDFIGRRVPLSWQHMDELVSDPTSILDYARDRFLPLTIQSYLQTIESGGDISTAIGGAMAQAVGLRDSPETAFEQLMDVRKDASKRLFGKDYEDLRYNSIAQDFIDEQDDVQAVINGPVKASEAKRVQDNWDRAFVQREYIRAYFTGLQNADDDALLAGSPAMLKGKWRDSRENREIAQANALNGIMAGLGLDWKEAPKGTVDFYLSRYYAVNPDDYTDAETREVDWESFFADQQEALDKLTRVVQNTTGKPPEWTMARLHRSDTRLESRYRSARESMNEYFELPRIRGVDPKTDSQIFQLRGVCNTTYYTLIAEHDLPADTNVRKALRRGIWRQMLEQARTTREAAIIAAARDYDLAPQKTKDALRNPARDDFLVNHPDLIMFFPDVVGNVRQEIAVRLLDAYPWIVRYLYPETSVEEVLSE